MKRICHTIDKRGEVDEPKLSECLLHNGQALLSRLELVEHSRRAIDELIDINGPGGIDAMSELSAG